jgi:hypothetical protein
MREHIAELCLIEDSTAQMPSCKSLRVRRADAVRAGAVFAAPALVPALLDILD